MLVRGDFAVEQIDVADELGDPARGRRLVKVARGRDLFEPAGIHHADPVGHRHRLFLVVGDDDEGHAEPALQLHQFQLRALTQLLVERGQRFVEQQDLGPPRQRARQRHALSAAGKLVRFALLHAIELDQRDHLGDAGVDGGARHAGALQPERDIVPHVEMRKQRVVLEHHVDRPLVRQHRRDVAAAEQDAALVGRLEAGKHPQQRGLAAAARAQQRKELARPDVERKPVHRAETAECLGYPLDPEQGMSAAASAGAADTSISGLPLSRRSSVMWSASPIVQCTLAADRHRLNRPGTSSHNILDAGHRSGKVRSSQKAGRGARYEGSGEI